ncbi:MAG: hypothetical protein AAF741_13085 [Bacteroidota bacterium]
MSKRKNSRSTSLFVAALATIMVSSCNRGVGCPANNMSVEDSVLDIVSNIISTLFYNGIELATSLVATIL